MKLPKILAAVVAVAAISALAVAEELKSGLEPGAAIGAFDVVRTSGPDDGVSNGDQLCYRCKYGARPMVMVFARSADEKLVALTKELDGEVGEHADKKLAAFINLMGADREAAEAEAKKLTSAAKTEHTPIAVPVEFENGPADYGINPDASVTVIVAKGGKVTASHAAGADGLTDELVKAIIEDVEKIVE